jgi:5-methylcytosine-specific restriction endonuclease McrA
MAISFYCYKCLHKPPRREARHNQVCPTCGSEYRQVSSPKVRAQTVSRLASLRGLPVKKRRKKKTRSTMKRDYMKYLQSPLWTEIRARVLERDNNTCQDCGGKASQVHHRSYTLPVMTGNNDEMLVSLCGDCHQKRHPEHSRKIPASGIQPTE